MQNIKKLYEELDTLIETTPEDGGMKKCYQEFQLHLLDVLAPEFETTQLYRELKQLWYQYNSLGKKFLGSMIKCLAKNCEEYIIQDMEEAKDDELKLKYLLGMNTIITIWKDLQ